MVFLLKACITKRGIIKCALIGNWGMDSGFGFECPSNESQLIKGVFNGFS